MISHRDRNRESGLDFMISMIGCGPRKGGWLLECFSLGENDDIICLGYAKVLPDNDKRVYAALSLPFYRLKRGRRWLLEQIRQLEAMGIKTQQGPLARGWLRLIVTLSKDNRLILALPPRFPKQPPTAIRWTDKFIKLAVDSLVGLPLNEWQLAKLAHKW